MYNKNVNKINIFYLFSHLHSCLIIVNKNMVKYMYINLYMDLNKRSSFKGYSVNRIEKVELNGQLHKFRVKSYASDDDFYLKLNLNFLAQQVEVRIKKFFEGKCSHEDLLKNINNPKTWSPIFQHYQEKGLNIEYKSIEEGEFTLIKICVDPEIFKEVFLS